MPATAPTTTLHTPTGGAASAAPIPAAPIPAAPNPAAPNPTSSNTVTRPDPTSNPDHPQRTDNAWNRLVKIENDPTGDDLAVHT